MECRGERQGGKSQGGKTEAQRGGRERGGMLEVKVKVRVWGVSEVKRKKKDDEKGGMTVGEC